jgi:hypothetical protein
MRRRATFLLAAVLAGAAVHADDNLPGSGFPASRYTELWTKSPFAVATPDGASGPSSPDYTLVGIASFDGVSYASIIDKQSNEHFLLSSAQPARGLTLVSVTPGKDAASASADIRKDGEMLTLKLESAPAPNVAAVMPNQGMPTTVPPGMPIPPGTPLGSQRPPSVYIHRPMRFIPMPPGVQTRSNGNPVQPSAPGQ